MAPPSWKECQYCRQKFSPSSLEIHMKRCRENKAVKLENDKFREERYMKSYHWATPLPDWKACPNCGVLYSPIAMGPHVKRCRRLNPKGAKGKGGGGGADGGGPPANAFDGVWGVDSRPLPTMIEKLGNSLKELVTGDEVAAMRAAEEAHPSIDADARARLKAIFDKFDTDGNGHLSQREHGMLLFNCFPDRMLDAKALLAEFKSVDQDKSGTVSFDEFLLYYGEMLLSQAISGFDEAADMFGFFDADHSGSLEQHEFLSLLNNVFPDHCEENEAACASEFAAATVGDGITFTEFCAYYDRLRSLYGDTKPLTPDEITRAEQAAKASQAKKAKAAAPPPPPPPAAAPASAAPKNKRRGSGGGGSKTKAASSAVADAAKKRLAELEEMRALGLITEMEYDLKKASILAESGAAPDDGLAVAAAPAAAPPPKLTATTSDGEALVPCVGCGELFLSHLLPKHQRSCAAIQPVKKTVRFEERPLPKPQDPYSSDLPEQPLPIVSERSSVAFAQNGSNSFVPCEKCGRTFFPDRLPIHMRACKGTLNAPPAEEAA